MDVTKPNIESDKTIPLIDVEATLETSQRYSMRVLVEAANPKNNVRMLDADLQGIFRGWCGDTMEIYLRLGGERIKEAAFMTDGGESAVACGSMLTKMLKGLSLATANKIKPEDLLNALGGLPPAKTHCATLTINALSKAISDLTEIEQEGDHPAVIDD